MTRLGNVDADHAAAVVKVEKSYNAFCALPPLRESGCNVPEDKRAKHNNHREIKGNFFLLPICH